MTKTKFDMEKAWSDAVEIIRANRRLLPIVAGVFFALPSIALTVLTPTTELETALANLEAGNTASIKQISESISIFLGKFALPFILYILVTLIGSLTILALMGKPNKPTVGEAIQAALKGILPVIAYSLILSIVIGVIALLAGIIVGIIGPMILLLLVPAMVVAIVFVSTRLTLVNPIIAVEDEYNPINAMTKSWAMVKGSTRYVFAFLLLIGIAIVVVSMIITLVFSAIGGIMGETALLWIDAIVGGLIGAVTTVLSLSIHTAIYQQLSGDISKSDLNAFE